MRQRKEAPNEICPAGLWRGKGPLRPDARAAKLDADSLAYDRALDREGKLVVAQALQSVKTSKSLRRRKGKAVVTDGPFAETKEQLLGFVMVEAADLAEALEIADGIPLAELGTIEVRAIYDIPGS